MTSSSASLFGPVATDALDQYPVKRGERLESHSFYLFHYHRFLHSDFYRLADWDVQGVAQALWALSRYEDPVGTLPVEPRLIVASLPRMTLEAWEGLMHRKPNPLHGWRPCMVGDERRLMHPVVTEVVLHALDQRDRAAEGRSSQAEAKRIERLTQQVVKFGHTRLAENEMFICRLDALLLEMVPNGANRTKQRIVEAMDRLGVRDLRS